MKRKIVIALDGPAGSGKSTTAKIVAQRIGYTYLDTGAMYRAITLKVLNTSTPITHESVSQLMNQTNVSIELSPKGQRTMLDSIDVTDEIRSTRINENVSAVSALPCVREKMVELQRELGQNGGVIIDGRDIGTVVFPNAELKIFMTANLQARAKRRSKELDEEATHLIAKQLEARDTFDSQRQHSPLTKASDAIEIDTTELSIEEQVMAIVELALRIDN